ncbi:MAG TPA: BON domain-containing protein [Pseudomonas sp.]|jgi:hyperosmotically inducible protein|uniref:BON domain-containing protein n=1 Tax=Pseudomonas sp. TaxID=306 RepID=UPI0026368AEE|nr:BON domain-containing protein [Pseudomonas sp.]HSX88450.1 BON domain-containing protein [Pseudomonas sp.]
MKKPISHFVVAATTATVLGLALAGSAFAETGQAVQPIMLATEDTMDKAGEVVSDTWITSKVKSTFLADDSLSGMDIKVETNKGVVSLSGVVDSETERDLAISKAKEIEGVTAVSADGLKTTD